MKFDSRVIKGIFLTLLIAIAMGFAVAPKSYAEQGAFEDEIVFVEPGVAPPTADSSEMVKTVADLITFAHSFFLPVINFLAYQIGNFMGSDYVYYGAMGTMLQKIWVISRNLVNIIFVFLLLWIALKEIFFVNKETDLKKSLITFVLLLVAVNFSWLATKVILDAANVATHVVFAIPSGISNPPTYGESTYAACEVNSLLDDPSAPTKGACYPTAVIGPADAGRNPVLYWEDKENCAKVQAAYAGSPESAYGVDGKEPIAVETDENGLIMNENTNLQHRTSICVENLNLLKYDQNTATIYLVYGMARIQNLVNSTGGTGDLPMLAAGSLLSLLIQLAYTVALAVLFIALIIRMGMLWLFVAFSPFMVLVIWFTGDIKADKDFGGSFKFGFTEFIKWAFCPAKVGAVFAVSFIMISAGQAMGEVDTTFIDNVASKTGMVFKILNPQSLFMGIGSLQTLIWLIMSLVVLWMGVFGVLGEMNIVKDVAQWVDRGGKYIGKMIATSPYWAPVLPLGKEGGMTSVSAMAAPIVGLKDDIKKYYDSQMGGGKDARKLQAAAEGKDYSNYGRKAADNRLTENDAKDIARGYGYTDVQEMMKENKDMLMSAFRTSKVEEGNAKVLYDKLTEMARPKTEEERKIEAQRNAEAQKAAGVGVGAGGTTTTTTTPAAPARPTPPAPPAPPRP